jgi:hypothetical protein
MPGPGPSQAEHLSKADLLEDYFSNKQFTLVTRPFLLRKKMYQFGRDAILFIPVVSIYFL